MKQENDRYKSCFSHGLYCGAFGRAHSMNKGDFEGRTDGRTRGLRELDEWKNRQKTLDLLLRQTDTEEN